MTMRAGGGHSMIKVMFRAQLHMQDGMPRHRTAGLRLSTVASAIDGRPVLPGQHVPADGLA